MLCTGFDRPNIEFIVGSKSENQWTDLKPYMTNVKGSVIIYVLKRALAEEIATLLQSHDIECDYYHAKMTPKRRKQVLEDFIRDRLKIIVATVAFGMGIDKPDVRCVIHYGASKNIETYYQVSMGFDNLVCKQNRDNGYLFFQTDRKSKQIVKSYSNYIYYVLFFNVSSRRLDVPVAMVSLRRLLHFSTTRISRCTNGF